MDLNPTSQPPSELLVSFRLQIKKVCLAPYLVHLRFYLRRVPPTCDTKPRPNLDQLSPPTKPSGAVTCASLRVCPRSSVTHRLSRSNLLGTLGAFSIHLRLFNSKAVRDGDGSHCTSGNRRRCGQVRASRTIREIQRLPMGLEQAVHGELRQTIRCQQYISTDQYPC